MKEGETLQDYLTLAFYYEKRSISKHQEVSPAKRHMFGQLVLKRHVYVVDVIVRCNHVRNWDP